MDRNPKWGALGPLKWETWLIPQNGPPHTYYLADFGRSTLKGVRHKNSRTPKLGSAGAPPSWDGTWLIPGRSVSNGVCINTREPQNGERWGPASLRWGRSWPPGTGPSPRVILPNLVVLGKNGASVVKEIHPKNDPSRTAFQITQGHRNWNGSIGCLSLPVTFISNHGAVSYCVRDKRRFQSKIANFPISVYLTPSLSLGNGAKAQENQNDGAGWARNKFNHTFSHLDTIHESDRRTDGW